MKTNLIKNNTAHTRIQMHVMKQQAPSNLNRDDSGAPKTCFFAGTERLRISSQCLKRAIRKGDQFSKLRNELESYEMLRSRMIREYIYTAYEDDEVMAVAIDFALQSIVTSKALTVFSKKESISDKELEKGIFLKPSDKKKMASAPGSKKDIIKSDFSMLNAERQVEVADLYMNSDYNKSGTRPQILTLSTKEIDMLVSLSRKEREVSDTGWISRAFGTFISLAKERGNRGDLSIDISLFGRMITGDGVFGTIDSPLQVAHAISTNEIEMDNDYWIVADDFTTEMSNDNDKGAGFLGDRPFSSGTFYHYINLDFTALVNNIKDSGFDHGKAHEIGVKIASALMRSVCMENPTGYQNSFASHPLANKLVTHVGTSSPFSAQEAFAETQTQSCRAKVDSKVSVETETEFAINNLNNWVDSVQKNYGDMIDGEFITEGTISEIITKTMEKLQ